MLTAMRLTQDQIDAIRISVVEVFGPDAEVRLFGSRVDDTKKGGDIDLYVVTPDRPDVWDAEMRFSTALWLRLGDRKIDILARQHSEPLPPIHKIAERRS